MVYFDNLHKSLNIFSRNWKIVVPAFFGFLMSMGFALIFIYINNLFPLLFRDPSGLFVSGGLSAIAKKISSVLPSVLKSPKLMMLTIPVVIYGIARYLYIIYEKGEGESPVRVLLSDFPILSSVLVWGVMIMGVIYLVPLLG